MVSFRMGHETEYATRGVADPGNIRYRSIGIERKLAFGGFAVRHGILNGNLTVVLQFSQRVVIGKKLAFAVPDGKLRHFYVASEDAG